MACGSIFALACLRRRLGTHKTRQIPVKLIYDSCKRTVQPFRTWGLHAFYLLLDTPGMDVSKYVKPSLSLIDAHILAENGVSEHSDYTKNASTMLTLMRTINALLVGLGPEIATNEGATPDFLRFSMQP